MIKRNVTFKTGASVPGGTKLWLTYAQADARPLTVTPLDKKSVDAALEEIRLAKLRVAAAKVGPDVQARFDAETSLEEARKALELPRPYLAKEPIFFAPGEALAIEMETLADRTLAEAMGLSPEDQTAERSAAQVARESKAKQAALKKATKEVDDKAGAVRKASTTLDKLKGAPRPSVEKIAAAERTLKVASEQHVTAKAALAALQE